LKICTANQGGGAVDAAHRALGGVVNVVTVLIRAPFWSLLRFARHDPKNTGESGSRTERTKIDRIHRK
jgi:hypothetical protein